MSTHVHTSANPDLRRTLVQFETTAGQVIQSVPLTGDNGYG
ncbi:MAG TPA: hypothetical protein PKE64_31145 [Anaerolineae bacterium]|nr:hypothetical protein [Anaerolineae bacterium]HMR68489.1 hypothetical protein [Anaerolineae bacterium]